MLAMAPHLALDHLCDRQLSLRGASEFITTDRGRGSSSRRPNIKLEHLRWDEYRAARVGEVYNAADAPFYWCRAKNNTSLLSAKPKFPEVLNGVHTGTLVCHSGIHIELLAAIINRDTLERQILCESWLEGARLDHRIGQPVLASAILDEVHMEVNVPGHLNGPAEADLTIALREVEIAYREVGPLDEHWHVEG
jgi:hypothetical protein